MTVRPLNGPSLISTCSPNSLFNKKLQLKTMNNTAHLANNNTQLFCKIIRLFQVTREKKENFEFGAKKNWNEFRNLLNSIRHGHFPISGFDVFDLYIAFLLSYSVLKKKFEFGAKKMKWISKPIPFDSPWPLSYKWFWCFRPLSCFPAELQAVQVSWRLHFCKCTK